MVKDIGIDFGIVNVLIYVQGKGVVLNELLVVVVDINNGKILVVGLEVYWMVGWILSNIWVVWFFKDGVIFDFDIIQEMFFYFIGKLSVKGFMFKFNIMICVLINIIEIECKVII